jgi:hypothetical protein
MFVEQLTETLVAGQVAALKASTLNAVLFGCILNPKAAIAAALNTRTVISDFILFIIQLAFFLKKLKIY